MKNILVITLSLISTGLFAQDIFGKWKTIDDNTRKAKSIVEIIVVVDNTITKCNFNKDSFCPPLRFSTIKKSPNMIRLKYIYEYMGAIYIN